MLIEIYLLMSSIKKKKIIIPWKQNALPCFISKPIQQLHEKLWVVEKLVQA